MNENEHHPRFEMPVSPIVAAATAACLVSLTFSFWLSWPIGASVDATSAWRLIYGTLSLSLMVTFLVLYRGHWRSEISGGTRFWFLLSSSALILLTVMLVVVAAVLMAAYYATSVPVGTGGR